MEVLESLFSKALKLERPWEITKIEFLEKDREINIFIDFHITLSNNTQVIE